MNSKHLFNKISNMLPSSNSEKMVYDHLLQSNDDGSQSSYSEDGNDLRIIHESKSKRQTLITTITKVILIAFAIWGLIAIPLAASRRMVSISLTPSAPRSCSCGGTTVAEAIRQGCKFTPLAIAWLPPHCLDMELADEFDRAGPGGEWEYWADLNATVPLTREEVSMLADTEGAVFYTTQEWHIMHCMYTWRKHYRSQFLGTTIEARSNGIDHIKHCEGIVRDRAPLLKIWTMAGIELNADLT